MGSESKGGGSWGILLPTETDLQINGRATAPNGIIVASTEMTTESTFLHIISSKHEARHLITRYAASINAPAEKALATVEDCGLPEATPATPVTFHGEFAQSCFGALRNFTLNNDDYAQRIGLLWKHIFHDGLSALWSAAQYATMGVMEIVYSQEELVASARDRMTAHSKVRDYQQVLLRTHAQMLKVGKNELPVSSKQSRVHLTGYAADRLYTAISRSVSSQEQSKKLN